MSVGRGTNQRNQAARSSLAAFRQVFLSGSALGLVMLVGCGAGQLADEAAPSVATPNVKLASAIRRVLRPEQAEESLPQPDLSAEQVADQEVLVEPVAEEAIEEAAEPSSEGLSESPYFAWSAASEAEPEPKLQLPPGSEGPAEDEAAEFSQPQPAEVVVDFSPCETEVVVAEEVTPADEVVEVMPSFATLLPPQSVADTPRQTTDSRSPRTTSAARAPQQRVAALELPVVVPTPEPLDANPTIVDLAIVEPKTPELDGLTDAERRLVEQVIRESSAAVTGVLTDVRVNEMASTNIRQANTLANRGAQYAARRKLIETLRMISQAKDAHMGDRLHTSALAAGLRALEEAEDFSPRGTQLEAELEVGRVVSAHRTPISRRLESREVLPRQMMDLYFRYAQVKLATSVAGEPAGSMALYALGKVASQMGQSEGDRDRISHRRAVAYQQAALLAHNQNYFAAHELAVLLAESGHLVEAENLLRQVAVRQPTPTVYRNLAHVQQRLGRTQLAAHSRAMATQMARSQGTGQIRWVGPEAFGTSPVTPSQYAGPTPMAARPPYQDQRTAMSPPPRSPQQYNPIPPGSWR